jgi:hypothetical protein
MVEDIHTSYDFFIQNPGAFVWWRNGLDFKDSYPLSSISRPWRLFGWKKQGKWAYGFCLIASEASYKLQNLFVGEEVGENRNVTAVT